jgi:hypothetical protein
MLKKLLISMFMLAICVVVTPKLVAHAAATATPSFPTTTTVTAITINQFLNVDEITVKTTTDDAIVRVYTQATGGKAVVVSKVTSAGSVVSVSEAGSKTPGKLYMSSQDLNGKESARTEITNSATKTATPASITITNNIKGVPDEIKFSSYITDTIVRVYKDSKDTSKPLATIYVHGNESAFVEQLGTKAGTVYVSIQENIPNKLESDRVAVKYADEQSTAPVATNFTVQNNGGANDIVTISALTTDANLGTYYFYTDKTTTTAITSVSITTTASATKVVDLGTNNLTAKAGSIYVSFKGANIAGESKRTAVKYSNESITIDYTNSTINGTAVVLNVLGTLDTTKTPTNSAFTVNITGVSTPTAVTAVDLTSKGAIKLTLSQGSTSSLQAVTVSYTAPTTGYLKSTANVKVDSASGKTIKNITP